MNDNLIYLYGLDCAKCSVPAHCHDVATGETYHVDARKPPCQSQSANPSEVNRVHSTGSHRASA